MRASPPTPSVVAQPVAEKQGGLGAQLSIMSLHPLPSVVPALADVQDTPGELYPERLVRSNVRGSIVSIIKVTQAALGHAGFDRL
jgi:hypothetical protein